MMGRLSGGQGQLFYEHYLKKLMPPDHLVRKLDAVLDLSWVSGELAPYYSHTGRPTIVPKLMLRMLIVGYVFAIRSERQLCSEVQVNMAYRWFCGLGLEDAIPDHSVFSRARHERFREAEVLRRLFEGVVGTCIERGLVDGVSFSLDASHIRADVNQVKRVPGDQADALPDRRRASRAVREYFDILDEEDADSGSWRKKPPKALSLTDPQAAWLAKRNTRAFFAYDANYLIDNKLGVIVDAEGTRANRIEENRVLKRIFKLDRLRLRGLSGARDEILLAATAQNLRKLARYAGPAPPNTTVLATAS